MAELKASEVKYSEPLKTKLGAMLFTATQIEFPASAETVTGGVELNLAKLGLTDEAIFGNLTAAGPEASVGEIAAKSALPIAAWTSGMVYEAKKAAESAVAITEATPIIISINANKLFMRFMVLKVATLNELLFTEGLTANKAKNTVGLFGTTVFVLGK